MWVCYVVGLFVVGGVWVGFGGLDGVVQCSGLSGSCYGWDGVGFFDGVWYFWSFDYFCGYGGVVIFVLCYGVDWFGVYCFWWVVVVGMRVDGVDVLIFWCVLGFNGMVGFYVWLWYQLCGCFVVMYYWVVFCGYWGRFVGWFGCWECSDLFGLCCGFDFCCWCVCCCGCDCEFGVG